MSAPRHERSEPSFRPQALRVLLYVLVRVRHVCDVFLAYANA